MSNFGDHPAGFFGDSSFYNGVATTSMRTDHITAKNVSRTPGSESNKRTFTFSTWFKRSFLDYSTSETVHQIFSSQVDGNDYFAIFFQDDGKLYVDGYHTQQKLILVTNRLFRDTSAWMNLVVAVDTTQGTAANRIKIYVNGVQETSFSTETYPPQNYDTYINDDVKHTLGSSFTSDGQRFGGYFADTNLIDGTQLTPASFGETKNGVWIPIDTGGLTFGTNGFRLKFNQTGVGTASTSTIGADTSGNNNHYASTNVGAQDCAMPDSPENNFCTMNPLHFRASYGMATMQNGNLNYGDSGLSSSFGVAFSTFNLTSGKWYAEILTKGNTSASVGVMNVGHYGYKHFLVQNPQNQTGNWTLLMDGTDTKSRLNGSLADPNYTAFNNDAVLGIALNADDKELSFFVDGTLQTGLGSSGVIDISTNGSSDDAWSFQAGTFNGSGVTFVWNFGQDSSFAADETATSNSDANGNGTFHTAPPSGFLAVCSANLPEPTIGPNSTTQADNYFNTVIYAGNNEATRTFDVGFVSDWSWFKARNQNGYGHQLYDSSRGVTKRLFSNTTAAEDTNAEGVTSFDSSGNLAIGTDAFINESGTNMVIWNWQANGGTATASGSESGNNPAHSIQANATAGFSIVTYTGTGGAGTVAHGLGAVPQMYIIKRRSNTGNWYVFHKDIGNTHRLRLDESSAKSDEAEAFNDTSPTSSVFSIGTSVDVNGDANTYVAYVFAEVKGYSKFGSYTGNGNADGTFIFTGFRPAWIMVKCTTQASTEWHIWDKTRSEINVMNKALRANNSNAESDSTDYSIDFLSNGLKMRNASNLDNRSGETFIYMAFAEAPFKYSNAR